MRAKRPANRSSSLLWLYVSQLKQGMDRHAAMTLAMQRAAGGVADSANVATLGDDGAAEYWSNGPEHDLGTQELARVLGLHPSQLPQTAMLQRSVSVPLPMLGLARGPCAEGPDAAGAGCGTSAHLRTASMHVERMAVGAAGAAGDAAGDDAPAAGDGCEHTDEGAAEVLMALSMLRANSGAPCSSGAHADSSAAAAAAGGGSLLTQSSAPADVCDQASPSSTHTWSSMAGEGAAASAAGQPPRAAHARCRLPAPPTPSAHSRSQPSATASRSDIPLAPPRPFASSKLPDFLLQAAAAAAAAGAGMDGDAAALLEQQPSWTLITPHNSLTSPNALTALLGGSGSSSVGGSGNSASSILAAVAEALAQQPSASQLAASLSGPLTLLGEQLPQLDLLPAAPAPAAAAAAAAGSPGALRPALSAPQPRSPPITQARRPASSTSTGNVQGMSGGMLASPSQAPSHDAAHEAGQEAASLHVPSSSVLHPCGEGAGDSSLRQLLQLLSNHISGADGLPLGATLEVRLLMPQPESIPGSAATTHSSGGAASGAGPSAGGDSANAASPTGSGSPGSHPAHEREQQQAQAASSWLGEGVQAGSKRRAASMDGNEGDAHASPLAGTLPAAFVKRQQLAAPVSPASKACF